MTKTFQKNEKNMTSHASRANARP